MIKYLLFTLLVVQDLMAYSESPYKVVHLTDKYEIRFYEERLVVQTQYTNQNNGFRKLFNYISGNNKQSEKISMTTPVNVTQIENEYVMQFYLPSKYKPNEMEQEFLTSVKSISISLKEIKEQFIIKNKIDSIRIAFNLTDNKTFSTLTKEQSKKVMREVNGQLNNISESIYGK